jgi:hypothetical protein
LAASGRAAVALPERTLEPGRPEWAHLPSGVLQAVVLGPDRLRTDTGEPIVVWVLSNRRVCDQVLVVDASASARRRGTRNVFEADAVSDVAELLRSWRASGTIPVGARARAVREQDIRRRHGDLRPATWIRDRTAARTRRASQRALGLATELSGLVNGPLQSETTAEQRRALDRLVKTLNDATGR